MQAKENYTINRESDKEPVGFGQEFGHERSSSASDLTPSPSSPSSRGVRVRSAIPLLLYLALFALYAATAAPGTLFGDPSEYQFVPAILGIAHPPGYAFYTLLARLWQCLVPVGSVAFRTNLLAAAVGAWAATAVYLTTRELILSSRLPSSVSPLLLPAFCSLSSLSLAAAPDFWQHAIHSNAHIVSAALAATHLWLLARWHRTGRDRWLAALVLTLGLAVTHHPITLMGVPAYILFILVVRPRILRQGKLLLLLTGCLLLGLAPFLYYPLRSPTAPFGPTDMNTWEGFLRHVTARGLRVNLFHFGLADQPDRATVLWSILRLQFPLPTLLLILLGMVELIRRAPRPALLLGLFLLGHLSFTLNTVQDVMAYLLLPLAAFALLAGVGGAAVIALAARLPRLTGHWLLSHWTLLLLLPWPFLQAGLNLSRGISLRDFADAEEWVASVYRRFDGQGEGAVLLSAWEYLTPLWVHTYTEGERLDETDVKLIYVSTATPWAESVWAHIEEGPVYLPDYRPPVRDAGFRLVPEGRFYRVVPPPASDASPSYPLDLWADGRIHIMGYDLVSTTVRAGEPLVLVLYQSAPEPVEGIWMPFAELGPVEARWTTDSRLLTNQWLPGEVVVERYEIPVPFTLPPGEYPLRLGYADLTGGREELPLSVGGTRVELARITVLPNPDRPSERALRELLANLDNQIALVEARARVGWRMRQAPWEEPLTARPGDPLHLTLTWRALAPPRDSYTVFIHLLDGAGRYVTGHDYTPLGGAAPTYLWFPKWLPGQTYTDPYRLVLPADLPPGDYWVEVGMYGMTSLRRLPVVDLAGSLAGDRVILGPVRVEAP